MITYKEALDYLGIDYEDEVVQRNVSRAMNAATATVRGAVGADVEKYLPDDPRVRELELIYLDDLYSTRGVAAKVSGATRQLVHTMELQVKMDLRKRREEAGA